MNREEIIRMAREAGINFDPAREGDDGIDCWYGDQYLPCGALKKFADLVEAAEREACAQVCESMGAMEALEGEEEGSAAMVRVADRQSELCAAAIRARE